MSDLSLSGQSVAHSRVLVVDDISKNLQVVGTMLRNEGYHVMPATSGPQALERAQAQPPDLILLDLMMPEMDGLEVCRRLKAEPLTRSIPVIFLTASDEMEHLVKGLSVGAVDYVTKPFNAPELLARVRTHLELQHARARLREMNDEKNEFMGIVAHDLRNPLGAIQGFAEIILEETEGSEGEVRTSAARIREATGRMVQMVQNLLDTNRIERGELRLELGPVELCALLKSVAESHRGRALAKQQSLSVETPEAPVSCETDRHLLAQVLENLVSNAIKYSPVAKDICLRLSQTSGGIRLEVQDQGPGLSPEDQKRLFGKFARLSAKPTAGERSTGLGLSIVKRMVEAMGGRVWCESELGRGARFFVEFPRG
jgi:signal transduction histidine kinase